MPEQDLDELNDSNSFLSQAINSAVKDLEHSVVDPDWFLQNDPAPPYPATPSVAGSANMGSSGIQQQPQHPSQVFQKPLPPPSAPAPSPIPSTSQSSNPNIIPTNSTVLIPSPFPSPSTILSSSNSSVSKQIDKIEGGNNKFQTKDSFDFEIVEQLIHEQQQLTEEVNSSNTTSIRDNISASQQQGLSDITGNNLQDQEAVDSVDPNGSCQHEEQVVTVPQTSSVNTNINDSHMKYRDAASSIKRFDPKFRALTEAFRLKTEEEAKAAAVAAESEADPSATMDGINAPTTQDSGIASQSSSQEDTLQDPQDQEDKLYKYISTPVSTPASVQNHSPSINNTHPTHPANVQQLSNTNTNMVSMPSSSSIASPLVNNERYQAYQNSRMVPDANLLQQTNQHLASEWNEIPKHCRSASLPNHSIAPQRNHLVQRDDISIRNNTSSVSNQSEMPNYSCYMNQDNNSGNVGTNRGNNLNIFVDNTTSPPPQQTLHSPSLISCQHQRRTQTDCMQQSTTGCSMTTMQRHAHANHQQQQVHHQQMVHTPTPNHAGGLLSEVQQPDAKHWPPQMHPNSQNQQSQSHHQQSEGSDHPNFMTTEVSDPNNPYILSNYQQIMMNPSVNDLMDPSQNQINTSEQKFKHQSRNLKNIAKNILSPSLSTNSEGNAYHQTANLLPEDSRFSGHSSDPFIPAINKSEDPKESVALYGETEKPLLSGDTDPKNFRTKAPIIDLHCDDQSFDPFFSSKVGKKKLASKQKLYSDKMKRQRSSHHHPASQQPSSEEKQLLSPGLVRGSELLTKSTAQNQHIKKAKLLASSEHRKHVEHKSNLLKTTTKPLDQSEPQNHFNQQSVPFINQQLYSPTLDDIKSDCASVPLSYETEEIVTTEEPDVLESPSPEKMITAQQDDGFIENSDDKDSTAQDTDTENQNIKEGPGAKTQYYNKDVMKDVFEDPVMKPPHKKRAHAMNVEECASSISVMEIETIKGETQSCGFCSYSTTSMVSFSM